MKRYVFLWILLLISPQTVLGFTVNDTDFEHKTVRNEEGYFIREVTAQGRHNFTLHLGTSTQRVFINNIIAYEEYYLMFGYVMDSEKEELYLSWLSLVDGEGGIIIDKTYNFGDLSEIVDVLYFDEGLVFLVQESEHDQSYVLKYTHFVRFDRYFDIFDTTYVDFRVVRKENNYNRYFLSDSYHGHFNTALRYDLTMVRKDDLFGVEPFGEYVESVYIDFINTVLIDQERHTNGAYIDYPGHYTLTFDETDLTFIVHPKVVGVKEGHVSHQPLSVHISNGQVFLNDQAYKSGDLIDQVGHHTLKILGINNYEKKLNFVMTSGLEGILNHQLYSTSRTLVFNGEGYLNHQPIKSGITLTEEGMYSLDIYGINGYYENYQFQIIIPVHHQEPTQSTTWMALSGIFVIATVVTLGILYKFIKQK